MIKTVQITMYQCTLYVRTQLQLIAYAIIPIAKKNANKKSNGNSQTVHVTEVMQFSDDSTSYVA